MLHINSTNHNSSTLEFGSSEVPQETFDIQQIEVAPPQRNDIFITPRKLSRLDSNHYSELHSAIIHYQFLKVQQLLKAGENVNILNRFGESPLIKACAKKYIYIAIEILKHQPDLSIRCHAGYTARAYCVFNQLQELENLIPADDYSTEFVRRKLLGHAVGIGMESQIGSTVFKTSVAKSPLMHAEIAKSLPRFYQIFHPRYNKIHQHQIIKAFQNAAIQRSSKEILTDILFNQLTIISTGWLGHAIDVVAYDQTIAICNRGPRMTRNNSTIAAYQMRKDLLSEALIQQILEMKHKTKQKACSFFYEQLPGLVNGNMPTPVSQDHIEEIEPSNDSVGICSFASGKAALRFAHWILDANKLYHKPFDIIQQEALRTSKEWATNFRITQLASYINSHSNPGSISPDRELIRKSYDKINRRLEAKRFSPLHRKHLDKIITAMAALYQQ